MVYSNRCFYVVLFFFQLLLHSLIGWNGGNRNESKSMVLIVYIYVTFYPESFSLTHSCRVLLIQHSREIQALTILKFDLIQFDWFCIFLLVKIKESKALYFVVWNFLFFKNFWGKKHNVIKPEIMFRTGLIVNHNNNFIHLMKLIAFQTD